MSLRHQPSDDTWRQKLATVQGVRSSRVIGDSFPEFGNIDSWKEFLGKDLLAHNLDVCAAGESSVL